MRKVLAWLGGLLTAAGAVIVGASVLVTVTKGGSPSINLGDPAQFQFILVPIWTIGVGLALLGGLCLLGWRRMQAA